jgi:probable F420-dependent oxidoreductase
MKLYIQSAFLTPEHLLEVARKTEEVGFYGVTVADHFLLPKMMGSDYPYADAFEYPDAFVFPDTWVTVAAMAAATTTIHFASAVYLALLRPPAAVAKAVATAAILSNYRVALCIGIGWMREEYEHVGEDFRTRASRHDEMVDLLREIWTGDWVDHHGRFYDYTPFRIHPAPKQHIPIWGAGHADAALRRAARLDGWMGANAEIPELLELVDKLRGYRRELGSEARPDYEIMSGLKDKIPTLEEIKRLEEAGVTALWVHPWTEHNTRGDPGLDVVLGAIEDYGEQVLAKL